MLSRADRRLQCGLTVTGRAIWTPVEDKILRRLYPDYGALKKALPNRSYDAIRTHARKLKIAKTRTPWTAREMSRFKISYPTCSMKELLVLFPGRTEVQIRAVAALKKLKKTERAHRLSKKTGRPILDAIRTRAAKMNYSLRELDSLAGTKSYFVSGGCRDLDRISRAIEALDGRLAIIWNDY